MPALTRRLREEIVVIDTHTGEQIVVAPTAYRGNQIRIGIEGTGAIPDRGQGGAG